MAQPDRRRKIDMRTSRKLAHALLALFAFAAFAITALAAPNITATKADEANAIGTANLSVVTHPAEVTPALSAAAYAGSFALMGTTSPPMATKNSANNAESAVYVTTQMGFNNGATANGRAPNGAGTTGAQTTVTETAMANVFPVTTGFVITS